MTVTHFRSAQAFRAWLQKHHRAASELWVGFYRKDSGKGGITYPEALDEALCFGWIDGVRKKADPDSYTVRFTPRQPKGAWSLVNIRRMKVLMARGVVTAAGRQAFETRDAKRSGIYSFEQRPQSLPAPYERRFKADKDAWSFFNAQPPGYRRTVIWWVISAKQEETRLKRLAKLMEESRKGRRFGMVTNA